MFWWYTFTIYLKDKECSIFGDMKEEESCIDSTHLSIFLSLALRIKCKGGICSLEIFAFMGNGSYEHDSIALISAKCLFRSRLRCRLMWHLDRANSSLFSTSPTPGLSWPSSSLYLSNRYIGLGDWDGKNNIWYCLLSFYNSVIKLLL